MNHKDNLGNESFVTAGGAQRFSAGRGMVHSEMPAETGESNGIQLWINLPQRLKKIELDYQQVDAAEFPVVELEAGQVKILVGENSPLALKTKVIYQHVTLNKTANLFIAVRAGNARHCLCYAGSLKLIQIWSRPIRRCLLKM